MALRATWLSTKIMQDYKSDAGAPAVATIAFKIAKISAWNRLQSLFNLICENGYTLIVLFAVWIFLNQAET